MVQMPPAIASAVKMPQTPISKTATGVRWSLRPDASELAKIDRLILETHQKVGERITISDVLRIDLMRLS
jgi:hypothetical protein